VEGSIQHGDEPLVARKSENLLTSLETVSFSREALLTELVT
jgi:hypothetical protein